MLAAWSGLIVLASLSGCVMPRHHVSLSDMAPDSDHRARLRAALIAYRDLVESSVEATSREILEHTTRATVRKASIDWRSRMVDLNDQAIGREDELVAMLDAWGLAARVHAFLITGDGKKLFAEHQGTANHTAGQLLEAIGEIASTALPAAQLPAVRGKLAEYTVTHPIRGVFQMGDAPPFTMDALGNQALAAVLQIPLLPFTALGQVGGGVGKALDMPSAVDRFTQAVRGLPEDARWQLDSVLADLQSGPAADRALKSFEQLSDSSKRLSDAAAQLPTQLRTELDAMLSKSDVPQERLQAVLADARNTVDRVDAAIVSARSTNADVRQTVESITVAADHLERTATAIGAAARDITVMLQPKSPSTAPHTAAAHRRPFDINDWTITADALTRTITELRGAIADLNRTMDSTALAGPFGHLSTLTRDATDHARGQAEQLANALTWRGAGLIVLTFVLAAAYARMRRSR